MSVLLLNHALWRDPDGQREPHVYRREVIDPVVGTRQFMMIWLFEILDPAGNADAEKTIEMLRRRAIDWPGLYVQHEGRYIVCFNLEGPDWDPVRKGKINHLGIANKVRFVRELKRLAGDEFLFGCWGPPPRFCPAQWTGGNPGDPLLGRRILERLNREMTPLGRAVDICFPGVYFSLPTTNHSSSLTIEEAVNYVESLILTVRGLYGQNTLCLPFIWPEGYIEWQRMGQDGIDTPEEQKQRRFSGQLFRAICDMACSTGDGFVLWGGQEVPAPKDSKPPPQRPPWDWNADWVQNGLIPICRQYGN